jgi:hypothetical protein
VEIIFSNTVLIKIRLQLSVLVFILNYKVVKNRVSSQLTYITKETEITNTCKNTI